MFFAITSYITGISSLIIAAFVFYKKPKLHLARLFCFFTISVAVYSIFLATAVLAKNKDMALFWLRVEHIGNAFIPTAYLHFSLEVIKSTKRWRWLLRTFYALSLFLVPTVFTDLWIGGVRQNFVGFNFYPAPGPLYILYFFMFSAGFIIGEILLFKAAKTLPGRQSKQALFVFFTGFLGSLAGSVTFLPLYGINIAPNINSLVILYLIALAYAILKYELLDIEVIIKKTLVFAGLFAMIMAVITVVSTFSQDIIGKYFSVPPTVATLISVVVAVALYDPCRKFLVNSTDRFLFQKKENIKDVLNKLSRNVITILDIDKVGQTILVALQTTLRVDSGVIIVKNENEESYGVLDAFGVQSKEAVFDKEDLFIRFFAENDRMINLEDEKQKNSMPVEVLSKLDRLKATIVMPLFIDKDLIGLLILGKKRSDNEFGSDELDYFPTVASQVAIALSNARLYDILKKSQINFAQQAKMAAIGTLSAGISHEIKNPLNHIKVGIAMLRMNKKHGLFDNMERYKMEEEVFKTLDILDENVIRANEVIDRLSSFAKKPKEQKVEPVDLRAAAESALTFTHNDLDHNSIEVIKEYEPEFPSIKADLHTMEDILLNLIVNARHAIGHHGKITIKGSTQSGDLDFSIRDTGKGIPKENLERIFDPFFTTKDVSRNPDKEAIKGSGLGLFIVREFIQRAGGQIHVESEVGKGTAFHLTFPKGTWV